jgi:hypothetical protein
MIKRLTLSLALTRRCPASLFLYFPLSVPCADYFLFFVSGAAAAVAVTVTHSLTHSLTHPICCFCLSLYFFLAGSALAIPTCASTSTPTYITLDFSTHTLSLSGPALLCSSFLLLSSPRRRSSPLSLSLTSHKPSIETKCTTHNQNCSVLGREGGRERGREGGYGWFRNTALAASSSWEPQP